MVTMIATAFLFASQAISLGMGRGFTPSLTLEDWIKDCYYRFANIHLLRTRSMVATSNIYILRNKIKGWTYQTLHLWKITLLEGIRFFLKSQISSKQRGEARTHWDPRDQQCWFSSTDLKQPTEISSNISRKTSSEIKGADWATIRDQKLVISNADSVTATLIVIQCWCLSERCIAG